jgi:hypothetical protein
VSGDASSVAERMFRPSPSVACPPVKMKTKNWMDRAAGAVDLMIDFATLGEYGLEPVAQSAGACEGTGASAGWEALGRARRGDCGLSPAPAGARA